MSLLINDNLIWVSTPKCASMSIENALYSSSLKIKASPTYAPTNKHSHVPLNLLKADFGNKESICITRDWFDKWLSALNHIWDVIEYTSPFELIYKWEDLNNEIIYKIFDDEFLNHLHYTSYDGYAKCFNKLILNEENINSHEKEVGLLSILVSEKFWKSNQKCTYEFDIKDIDKFVLFIENRFGEKLIIEKMNTSSKKNNNIIINEELKQFVWDKFEKRFEKNTRLV
jgi:hypothetical protein